MIERPGLLEEAFDLAAAAPFVKCLPIHESPTPSANFVVGEVRMQRADSGFLEGVCLADEALHHRQFPVGCHPTEDLDVAFVTVLIPTFSYREVQAGTLEAKE